MHGVSLVRQDSFELVQENPKLQYYVNKRTGEQLSERKHDRLKEEAAAVENAQIYQLHQNLSSRLKYKLFQQILVDKAQTVSRTRRNKQIVHQFINEIKRYNRLR